MASNRDGLTYAIVPVMMSPPRLIVVPMSPAPVVAVTMFHARSYELNARGKIREGWPGDAGGQ